MTDLSLLVAYVLGTLAVARATRLVTFDPYPPVSALREWWVDWQESRDYDPATMDSRTGPAYGWAKLATCPYCAAPYITAITLVAAILGDVWTPGWGGWWLTLAVWASASYLAAILVAWDVG